MFVFVDDLDEVPADATPFDMRGAEPSLTARTATFEAMLHRYGLGDPVLWDIARIVHEADLEDEQFAPRRRRAWTCCAGACR